MTVADSTSTSTASSHMATAALGTVCTAVASATSNIVAAEATEKVSSGTATAAVVATYDSCRDQTQVVVVASSIATAVGNSCRDPAVTVVEAVAP